MSNVSPPHRTLILSLVVILSPLVLMLTAVAVVARHAPTSADLPEPTSPSSTAYSQNIDPSLGTDSAVDYVLVKDPKGSLLAGSVEVGAGWYRVPTTAENREALSSGHLVTEVPQKVSGFVLPQDAWGLEHFLDHDVDASAAWGVSRGSGVVVAVIDTGVDISHPALSASVWRNPGEICGNGVDDDGNGFVDDCFGWNFADNSPEVYASPAEDSHGTHVAGVVAANSPASLMGLAPEARVMVVKFMKGDSGWTDAAAAAINYAVDNGADVVNLSWGGESPSQAVADAVDRAISKGVVVVAAAGNHGANLSTVPVYPAAHSNPALITVAAHSALGGLAPFSAYGTDVDVSAPGVGVVSALPSGRRGVMSGTSMAAPFVSAAAALYLDANPSASPRTVRNALVSSAAPRPDLAGRVAAGGVLKAGALLGATPSDQDDPTPPVSNSSAPVVELTVRGLEVEVAVTDKDSVAVSVVGVASDGARFEEVVDVPATLVWELSPTARWLQVTATDPEGNVSREVVVLSPLNPDRPSLPPLLDTELPVFVLTADLDGDGVSERLVFSLSGESYVLRVGDRVLVSGSRRDFDPASMRTACVDPSRAVFVVLPAGPRESKLVRFDYRDNALTSPQVHRTSSVPPLLVSSCEIRNDDVVLVTRDWRVDIPALPR